MFDVSQNDLRRRTMLVVDLLLLVAAVVCVVWASFGRPRVGDLRAAHAIQLRENAAGAQRTIFIDATNRIHLGPDRFDSADRLCSQLTTVPASVLLLVHPDGLIENVMRTISALHRTGVQEIQLGSTESTSSAASPEREIE